MLFDRDNPRSCELRVAVAVGDALADCATFRELSGTTTQGAARAKVVLGLFPEPPDGQQFGVDDLADDFCHAVIMREDGTHIVLSPLMPGSTAEPEQQGQLEIGIRRYVRESETDAFLFVWDCLSKIAVELQQAINSGLLARVTSIREAGGPYLPTKEAEVAQGRFVWGRYVATWGDVLGGES